MTNKTPTNAGNDEGYRPKPGHKVRAYDSIYTVVKVSIDRMGTWVRIENKNGVDGSYVDFIEYVPRHRADENHHSFRHSDPDVVWFDPDSPMNDDFFAGYRPKHRRD